MAQLVVAQQDFSAGAVPAVSPPLIPENGVYAIRNGMVNEDGAIYRRGGSEYVSGAAFGSDRLSYVWSGNLAVGERTLIANPSDFGVLDSNGSTVINLGSDGLPYPKPSATIKGMVFIGGGHIYGGSRLTSNYTNTVTFTTGSATVTGTGFTANVDAGMLLRRAVERVYVVKSVDSDTSLTLTEPYEGVGAAVSSTFYPIYKMTTTDPYEVSDVYAFCQNRLVWAAGNKIQFSEVGEPDDFPLAAGLPINEHELPPEASIRGLVEVGSNLLVFTSRGTWVLRGLAFDIVDSAGNPQHQLSRLSDATLIPGAGYARWEQVIIAPFVDGVYMLDGVSEPRKISQNIDPNYDYYASNSYRAGQAVVYKNHYFLPFILDAGTFGNLYCVQLDRQSFDRRRRTTFPWSWHDGEGGKVSALAVALTGSERTPKLFAAETATTARLIDNSAFLDPEAANSTDADGSAHELDIILRDYASGANTINAFRSLRVRAEISDPAALEFLWSDGATQTAGAKWDQAVWDTDVWASESGAVFYPLTARVTENLNGSVLYRCRINKKRRLIRFRIRSTQAVAKLYLRSVEVFVRPSNAVRR